MVAKRLKDEMREEGIEEPHLDASSPHLAPEGATSRKGSPGVGQDLDDDSALHRSCDHVEEGEPGAIVFQDVGLDQDLAPRLVDRLPRGGERLLAAEVGADAVAFQDRRFVDAPEELSEAVVAEPLRQRGREPADVVGVELGRDRSSGPRSQGRSPAPGGPLHFQMIGRVRFRVVSTYSAGLLSGSKCSYP